MAITDAQKAKLNKMNRAAQDATLGTVIQDLQNATTPEVSDLIAAVGTLSSLHTSVKTSLVAAINEVQDEVDDIPSNAVAGVAGDYRLARGTATITQASQTVATGLTTVVTAVVSLAGDPSTTHTWSTCTIGDQAGAPVAGSIVIKSWKPTAVDNVTPIAADTVFGNVSWIAIGT